MVKRCGRQQRACEEDEEESQHRLAHVRECACLSLCVCVCVSVWSASGSGAMPGEWLRRVAAVCKAAVASGPLTTLLLLFLLFLFLFFLLTLLLPFAAAVVVPPFGGSYRFADDNAHSLLPLDAPLSKYTKLLPIFFARTATVRRRCKYFTRLHKVARHCVAYDNLSGKRTCAISSFFLFSFDSFFSPRSADSFPVCLGRGSGDIH
ncbi:hypothetical protein DQ04_01591020 [Trypanosoma grayi]|uniref:hypothetical protein n=1 Tax=Trypanosoma grayi TaxID=71804 RepID=UPI0004F444E6|nr:hypothetical protein DQ04_01591020 [Trypanosoma grayi]KEG12593.1 hypothetical protein DQ04_01591020 [Trypanosoma grayi]